ncbi:MAG: type I DNA topoisomerase [Clostridia bacterium]|nr:type I DNA topoisomerase [Clostridia bacterium]
MSKLVIVESPTKVKSIKKYLGSEFSVMASMGHVRDLPTSKMGVDIKNNFEPQYVNIDNKKDLIKQLKNAVADSDFVYLATDPDREGEAISWHLAQILGLDMSQANRVTFNEITKTGVTQGMAKPRSLDVDLVDAQQARRVLDRIVGYKLSPFLWKKVKRGLSAGRVQSVALKLIVDREKKIMAFVPEEYWTLDAKLVAGRKGFVAKFYGTTDGEKLDIHNGDEIEKIVKALDGAEYVVSKIKKGVRNKQPAPPFITSTMQQEASRKLSFTAQKTMRVAQQLYEGVDIEGRGATGLITYMRTDSLRISDEARAAASKYILSTFGDKYIPKTPRYFKTKAGAQDAHEAIRPTDVFLTPESVKGQLSAEQYKLYKLIWERFIASLMSNCVQDTVAVDITANDYLFKASGYSVRFDGFTTLYEEGKDVEEADGSVLPEMQENDILKLKELIPAQHYTTPPARYTEPTLIKALEENGIGRPSTYASILSNIIQRDYIEREKKTLKPTSLGIVVSDLISKHFKNIVDVKFTAGMESNLDSIATGELEWKGTISEFYKDFEVSLNAAEQELTGKRVSVPAVESDIKCEKCGRTMVVKSSRFGKFLACPGYPECKNTKPMPEDEIKQPCPKCGSKLVKRNSKKTGKAFYGCTNYPQCDFASPGLPTGDVCAECGSYIITGRGRKYCMNSACPSRAKKSSKKDK